MNKKLNLEELHWQEFELISFRVLQKLISTDVQFIEGGSDKGRDIIFSGKSCDYKKTFAKGEWVFQAKHKTTKGGDSALLKDLEIELEKVFIKNKLPCDYYILVTNLPISGSLNDKAKEIVRNFKLKNSIIFEFDLLGYRHIESCVDSSEELKWAFPNIIKHPDFNILLKQIFSKGLDYRIEAFLENINKSKDRFVSTQFYKNALAKLNSNHIIILSGPPKSGKTFNGEILAYNYSLLKKYDVVRIFRPSDFEQYFDKTKKQLFICDDAFGTYSVRHNHQEWSQRLLEIFELVGENHKIIFTSREYVYRGFVNKLDNDFETFLNKIIVESHNYSKKEKSALLTRYTKLSLLSDQNKKTLLEKTEVFINHKNFSPETIRAFFANLKKQTFSEGIIKKFQSHLDAPDAYLKTVFDNLSDIKKAVVLSVLCSYDEKYAQVIFCFSKILKDINSQSLRDYNLEYDELDNSILRIFKSDKAEEVQFYHPSMQAFLVRLIAKTQHSPLRSAILKNINIDVLNFCYLSPEKSIIKNQMASEKLISLSVEELELLKIGLIRSIKSNKTTISYFLNFYQWYNSDKNLPFLKISDPEYNIQLLDIISEYVQNVSTNHFYSAHKNESANDWAELFGALNKLKNTSNLDFSSITLSYYKELLSHKKGEDLYWKVALRLFSFVNPDELFEFVGRDWLNSFYTNLKEEIYGLGNEFFGDDFPDFKMLQQKRKKGINIEKMIEKPNKKWYPRFLKCQEKMNVLKEIQGTSHGKKMLSESIGKSYREISLQEKYARNRHLFNVDKGWWN